MLVDRGEDWEDTGWIAEVGDDVEDGGVGNGDASLVRSRDGGDEVGVGSEQ